MNESILIASTEIRKLIREEIREEIAKGLEDFAMKQKLERRINSEQLYDHFGISRPTGIKLKRYLIKAGQLNPVSSENGREYFLLSEVIGINPKTVLRKLRQSK